MGGLTAVVRQEAARGLKRRAADGPKSLTRCEVEERTVLPREQQHERRRRAAGGVHRGCGSI